jgi:hypothetical protein
VGHIVGNHMQAIGQPRDFNRHRLSPSAADIF